MENFIIKKLTVVADGGAVTLASILGIDSYTTLSILESVTDLSAPGYKIGLWGSLLWLFIRMVGFIIDKYYKIKHDKRTTIEEELKIKLLKEELKQLREKSK